MFRVAKKSMIFFVAAAMLLIPFSTGALAEEYFEAKKPGSGDMMWDAVVVRPVGIIATVIGSAFWVVSLPFTLLANDVDSASEKLVKDPARYTFKRPLGEF